MGTVDSELGKKGTAGRNEPIGFFTKDQASFGKVV